MQIGLMLTSEFAPGTDLGSQLANLIEQARVARDSGFRSLWVTQHFVTGPVQQFQTMPLLGMLAADAGGMTIGTSLMLLPMLNPVLLAEEAATVDWLCDGRFILGVGLGYRDHEFSAMGVRGSERVGRLVEYIDVIRQLWTEDAVDYDGRYVKLEQARLSVKPKRSGGVPIWVGGTVEAAIRRAARIGDLWLPTASFTMDEMREKLGIYRKACAEFGRVPAEPIQISRECYVGASRAAALAEASGPIMSKYERYMSYDYTGIGDGGDAKRGDFETFARDRFIVGDEAFVQDELVRYRDTFGSDAFRMRMQWPGLSQAQVLKSIERLGKLAAAIG